MAKVAPPGWRPPRCSLPRRPASRCSREPIESFIRGERYGGAAKRGDRSYRPHSTPPPSNAATQEPDNGHPTSSTLHLPTLTETLLPLCGKTVKIKGGSLWGAHDLAAP